MQHWHGGQRKHIQRLAVPSTAQMAVSLHRSTPLAPPVWPVGGFHTRVVMLSWWVVCMRPHLAQGHAGGSGGRLFCVNLGRLCFRRLHLGRLSF